MEIGEHRFVIEGFGIIMRNSMAKEEMLQLIEQIDRSMECILESKNPIHGFGWLFDSIVRWKRQLREIETEIKNMNF